MLSLLQVFLWGFAEDGLNKRKQLVSASSLGQNNLLFQSLLLATSTWVTHLVTKLQSSEAGAFNVAPADLGPVGALGFCLSMRLTTCTFTPTDLQATVRRHRVIVEQNLCRMFLAHLFAVWKVTPSPCVTPLRSVPMSRTFLITIITSWSGLMSKPITKEGKL